MKEDRRSAFIALIMPDASDAERTEATANWFEFLGVLADIAARRVREADSRGFEPDGKVDANTI